MLFLSLDTTTRPFVFSTNFGLLLPIGSIKRNEIVNMQIWLMHGGTLGTLFLELGKPELDKRVQCLH